MKKAIIIGATSGIGRELAKIAVNNGYITGITGRRLNLLEEIKKENPEKYFVKPFDVANTSVITQLLDELVSELGGLDLLVICSGIGDINKSLDFSVEKRTIETNVVGFTAAADWAFNFFEKQKIGHLVNISSVAGLRGNRFAPSYSGTKSYQINYLEALRQKAGKTKFPIAVTDIRPGFVDTNMAKGEGLFWVAPVEKAAEQIYMAIKQKRKVAYITRRWAIIALIYKLIPRCIYDRL